MIKRIITICFCIGLLSLLPFLFREDDAELEFVFGGVESRVEASNILDSLEKVEDGEEVVEFAYDTGIEVPQQSEFGYKEIIEERTSYSFVFQASSSKVYINYSVDQFKPEITKDGKIWKQVEIATTTKENFKKIDSRVVRIPIFLRAERVKALGYWGVAAGDGDVYTSGSTWSTLRNASTGTLNVCGSTYICPYNAKGGDGTLYLGRGFFNPNTANLTDTDTVNEASINLKTYFIWLNLDNCSIAFSTSSQADPTTLATGDYDNITLNSQPEIATRVLYSDFSVGNYKTIPISATYMDEVNKTGYSKFSIRGSLDADNTEIVSNNRDNCVGFYSSNSTGTSSDPYLVTTTTPAVAGTIVPLDIISSSDWF